MPTVTTKPPPTERYFFSISRLSFTSNAANFMPLGCSARASRLCIIKSRLNTKATSCCCKSLIFWSSSTRSNSDWISSMGTSSGLNPINPSNTPLSVPCPKPVKPSEPYSCTETRTVCLSKSCLCRYSTNIFAARIGPTVCELDGPMPILNRSNTDTAMLSP